LTSVKYNVLESANVYNWVVAAGSLETFVTFYQTALRQIPEDKDWIDVAEDRDMWWAVVNAVMNLRVP
jgi:hypothetical protein